MDTPAEHPPSRGLLPPTPMLPPDVAARFGARVLNPVEAVALDSGRAPNPTAYVGNHIMFVGVPLDAIESLTDDATHVTRRLGPPPR